MKHGIDKHWKPRSTQLSQENRIEIKKLIESRVANETENQIAIQIAICVAKIIRKDGNGSWPDLLNLLHLTLKQSHDERAKYHRYESYSWYDSLLMTSLL